MPGRQPAFRAFSFRFTTEEVRRVLRWVVPIADARRYGFSDEANAASAIMSSSESFWTCFRICCESTPWREPDCMSYNWRTM